MSPKDAKDSERDLEFSALEHRMYCSCFFADHGNKAFQVALGVNASEEGQPSPRKIAHLMAKESRYIL
eukprot:9347325-Ditylum_brightwellii.AAC.1